MRGKHEVRYIAVGPFGGNGFDLEDVEGGAPDLTTLESLGKDILIDQATTSAIDDSDAFLEERKLLATNHVLGLFGERHVHRDEVG